MATTAPTLTCKECGYVNEAERVYCHNCGGKLDRSVLPKEPEAKREKHGATRKRIQRMANPGGSAVKRGFVSLLKTLAYAAALAALILAVREPAGVPPAKGELALRLVSSELMDAAASPQPRNLAFTESEVNAFLRQSIKGSETTNVIPGVKFDRAFVNFEPGQVHITSQRSVAGYPLYSSVIYKLEVQGEKMVPTLLGGSFGRLAVHPFIMQFADFSFDKLWSTLKRERAYIEAMRIIQPEKDRILLQTRGNTVR